MGHGMKDLAINGGANATPSFLLRAAAGWPGRSVRRHAP